MRKGTLITLSLCALIGASVLVQGCAATIASKQQTRKDLSVVRIGGDRDEIVQVLGAPSMTSRNEDGTCKDYYKIVEGAPSKVGKTLTVVGHATASVVTLGLWEIAGTPIELARQKDATTFVLHYGADNKLVAYDAYK